MESSQTLVRSQWEHELSQSGTNLKGAGHHHDHAQEGAASQVRTAGRAREDALGL